VMKKKKMTELIVEMRKLFGHWSYSRADLALSKPLDTKRLQAWGKKIQKSGKLPVSAGVPLASVGLEDGVKLVFENNSWLLFRPSGTEPLLRIYSEAKGQKQLEKMLKIGQRIGQEFV